MVKPDIKEAFFNAYPEIARDKKITGSPFTLEGLEVIHFNPNDPFKTASLCNSADRAKGSLYVDFTRSENVAYCRRLYRARTDTNGPIYQAEVGMFKEGLWLYKGFSVSDNDLLESAKNVNLLDTAKKFPRITVESAVNASTILARMQYFTDDPQSQYKYIVYLADNADGRPGVFISVGNNSEVEVDHLDGDSTKGCFGDKIVAANGFDYYSGKYELSGLERFGPELIYFKAIGTEGIQTLVVPKDINSRYMCSQVLGEKALGIDWRDKLSYIFPPTDHVGYTLQDGSSFFPA